MFNLNLVNNLLPISQLPKINLSNLHLVAFKDLIRIKLQEASSKLMHQLQTQFRKHKLQILLKFQLYNFQT